jgi:hypothetical protein
MALLGWTVKATTEPPVCTSRDHQSVGRLSIGLMRVTRVTRRPATVSSGALRVLPRAAPLPVTL